MGLLDSSKVLSIGGKTVQLYPQPITVTKDDCRLKNCVIFDQKIKEFSKEIETNSSMAFDDIETYKKEHPELNDIQIRNLDELQNKANTSAQKLSENKEASFPTFVFEYLKDSYKSKFNDANTPEKLSAALNNIDKFQTNCSYLSSEQKTDLELLKKGVINSSYNKMLAEAKTPETLSGISSSIDKFTTDNPQLSEDEKTKLGLIKDETTSLITCLNYKNQNISLAKINEKINPNSFHTNITKFIEESLTGEKPDKLLDKIESYDYKNKEILSDTQKQYLENLQYQQIIKMQEEE